MSARATYHFRDEYSDATLYIHHDGYPEGAAAYMLAAIKQSGGRLNAEAMIRSNVLAELTSRHTAHADTEYRYTIDVRAMTVTVDHRDLTLPGNPSHPGGPQFHRVFAGKLVDFLNGAGDQEVRQARANCLLTQDMAESAATRAAKVAADYKAKFQQYVGNYEYQAKVASEAIAFAREFGQKKTAAQRAGGAA